MNISPKAKAKESTPKRPIFDKGCKKEIGDKRSIKASSSV